MDVATWFRQWLTRHPLNTPAGVDRARFTADVMAKINALPSVSGRSAVPAPVRVWTIWRRLSLTVATVAAGAAIAVVVLRSSHQPTVRLAEPLVVAEAQPDDDEWLQETLQLLDQLDEDVASDAVQNGTDKEWMQELQMLDETELSTGS